MSHRDRHINVSHRDRHITVSDTDRHIMDRARYGEEKQSGL